MISRFQKLEILCGGLASTFLGTNFPGGVAFANFRTRSIIKYDTSTTIRES